MNALKARQSGAVAAPISERQSHCDEAVRILCLARERGSGSLDGCDPVHGLHETADLDGGLGRRQQSEFSIL